MSCSPERISSYRRHFEDSSSLSYQVRVSSPSPTRRVTRNASAGYPCRPGGSSMRMESAGRRTISAARKSRVGSAGAMICVGPSGEPAMDLDVAAAENQEFLNIRTGERQEMIVLNDRLAVYIDKVRSLEQQSKLLEAEIEAYQGRFGKPSGLRLLYEEQLRELKKIAEQIRVQRDITVVVKVSTAAQLQTIKVKYEEAVELRRKAEADIEVFRPDVDKATSSRITLEKKLEQLEVEIEFLKRVHLQEIEELMRQIYSAHVTAQSSFTLPDLAGALKQIQTQYDDIAAKNLQEMDSWYKNKFENITMKTNGHVDKVRGFRGEIAGAKKSIQSKERDLDAMRTRNEALEAQVKERQEKYKRELEELQARIEALQLELKSTKVKIALHMRDYQELLNVKMNLEIEITTYRKLIEGEDLRLAGMMQTLSLASCSMTAITAGMGGGGMGGAGGMGGGLSGGGAGVMGNGAGMGGGMGAGGTGASLGSAAGMGGGGMGAAGPDDKTGPAGMEGAGHMIGSHGYRAGGVSGGLGAGSGGVVVGAGAGVFSAGVGGMGTALGGVGSGVIGVGTVPGDVGAGGLDGSDGGLDAGAEGLGAGAGGMGAGGVGGSAGGLDAGAGVLRAGAGGVGAGGVGAGGLGGSAGGLDAGAGGLGAGAGSVGAGGLAAGVRGVGAGDLGAGGGGLGAGGGVAGAGGLTADAGSLGTGAAGVVGAGAGAGGRGAGAGDVGAGAGAEVEGAGAGGVGVGAGDGRNLGLSARVMGDSMGDTTAGMGVGAGMGGTGMDFSGGSHGIGGGSIEREHGGIDGDGGQDHGMAGGGIGGGKGSESVGGMKSAGGRRAEDDVGVAVSGVGGTGPSGLKSGVGMGVGYGSNGFDTHIEAYAGQAVELTERRTVLIRTVKNDDDTLETDHQEQIYTISGAADDSDNE